MTRRQLDPLHPLTEPDHAWLTQLSRSSRAPAGQVARAKALLAVAGGASYTEAALRAGRRSGDAVSQLVARFNREGLAALAPRHGGGPAPVYAEAECERILAEVRRPPDRDRDRTATWSLLTLRRALRRAPDGLPKVSTFTIWEVLHEAGWSWQQEGHLVPDRSRPAQAQAWDRRSARSRCHPQKKLIEAAYTEGESLGLAVWGQDEAGPYQTIPYPGASWEPEEHPACQPHEYFRQGTAKLLTLFHPATGQVRVKGTRRSTNAVLHPWLKEELTAVLATLPPPVLLSPAENRARWERWQAGLKVRITLPCPITPATDAADLG